MSNLIVIQPDIHIDPVIKSKLEQIASTLPDGEDWSILLMGFQLVLDAEEKKRKEASK